MTIATIHKISLPYEISLTEEELKRFNKYDNTAGFKTEEDFAVRTYEDRYKEMTEEERNAERDQKYLEYCSTTGKTISLAGREIAVDLTLFTQDFPNIEFIYKGPLKVHVSATDQQESFLQIAERFENVAETLKSISDVSLNQQCNVHIGGGLLMMVNETTFKEDYCTNELQTDIDNGWRILAVCVQPDGRKPDYILGKYNPDKG